MLPEAEKKALCECLNAAKIYLKVKFKLHCEKDESCPSHCLQHALSNPSDNKLSAVCSLEHTDICSECFNLIKTMQDIQKAIVKLPDSREKELAMHDIQIAEAKITEWKRHIVRGVQQSKARACAFSDIRPDEAVWIRDFAQKVNPSKVHSKIIKYHCNTIDNETRCTKH